MRPELSAGGERSLRNFLGELVWRHFFEDVRLEEPRVTTYVASLLADFARTENLYRIRDAQGKRLEEVGEMLVESNPLLEAASFDRERELRKHVGDYTLFMTDRKSTRLNSSHGYISYAVFCLKKKKKHSTEHTRIHTGSDMHAPHRRTQP